jgi:hypothetical protein
MFHDQIFRIKSKTLKPFLAAIFVAGRFEYFMADMLPFITGIFLGLSCISYAVPYQRVVIGLAITICAHYISVWANVLGDYELDKRYKSYLPKSVDIIGKRNLIIAIIFMLLLGTSLILYLVSIVGFVILILWIVGIFFAFAYSNEPLRLKKYIAIGDFSRGIQLVILLPFGFFIIAHYTDFSMTDIVSLLFYTIGLSINLFGLFLIGETWDWKDDIGFVNTFATKYGYKMCLNGAIILMPLGIALMMIGYFIKMSFSNNLQLVYLILWIILSIIIIGIFYYYIYSEKDHYEKIEIRCGIFTMAGTTAIWCLMAVSCYVLTLR